MEICVEHENNPRTFRDEIQKLLSVRSPLKVGVSYVLQSDLSKNGSRMQLIQSLQSEIREQFKLVDKFCPEGPNTEYLFLIGCDIGNYELEWSSLQFSAVVGPQEQVFA